jgi:hypothetical protein
METQIEVGMDDILYRLDLILTVNESNEATIRELTERMGVMTDRIDVLIEIIQTNATNAVTMGMWNIALYAFGISLLCVLIFAVAWRR